MAQPQVQKWARCSTAVFPLVFTFREKPRVPPVPEDYNTTPPPLRMASPPCVVTVYNKLTGSGWVRVSPSEHPAYLAPAFGVFCLLSVVFSRISRHPQLGF
jgi:hypothetical protein